MEKLELKHLAPYLPYGLKVKLIEFNRNYKVGSMYDLSIQLLHDRFKSGSNSEIFKPILRPISDLFNEDFEKDELGFSFLERLINKRKCDAEYDFIEALEDDKSSADEKMQFAPYSIIVKLLEKHFDVFGLIPTGLAIDINTI
jgi:hypothetical protein